MENFRNNDISFEDLTLNNFVTQLKNCYYNKQNNFAEFCKCIYNIRQCCKDNYYKAKNDVYYDFYSLLESFGIGKTSAKCVCACYERFVYDVFVNGDVPIGGLDLDIAHVKVKKEYEDYSSSKLFELLPLSEKMLANCLKKKIITADMTVKEIRKKVKELAGQADSDNLVIEDLDNNEEKTLEEQLASLPEAYDPKKYHDLAYFKQFDKATLIDFLFMAEDYIKKLTKKTTKKAVD